jgi:hypothetical protein
VKKRERSVADQQIFAALVRRIKDVALANKLPIFQALPRWFIPIYYDAKPGQISIMDAKGDGKADSSFEITEKNQKIRVLINSKFTMTYNKLAPPAFYDELLKYKLAFDKKSLREEFLAKTVRHELRAKFVRYFDEFDQGRLRLFFLTNCRQNDNQMWATEDVECYHFEDIAGFVIDDLEVLIPRTKDLSLKSISQVLSPGEQETEIPTSVVFAKLIDFITYMDNDPLDLLFARNVRLNLGNTPVNDGIRDTFKYQPKEFAFSNNGITMLSESIHHDPGTSILTLSNPRVVNGSQTLHSIRETTNPSGSARIMVRIIQVPTPPHLAVSKRLEYRKEIIGKISFRSNQQNPIKLWDLCSNDENQVAIQMYFRKKGLYYETRTKEWTQRKDYLSADGVKLAMHIRTMGQLFASYRWNSPGPLGPAAAKNSASSIFDRGPDGAYEEVRKLKPDLAYNLYLLKTAIASIKFPKSMSFYHQMKRHANLCLFAMVCKSLDAIGFDLKTPGREIVFDDLGTNREFRRVVMESARVIHKAFDEEKKRQKTSKKELTYNNFFKNESYLKPILAKSISRGIAKATRLALNV